MSRALIACMNLDLRQLDEVMIHIPGNLAGLVRWLVATADLQNLNALHEVWSAQANIIPCLVPDWSPEAEQCIELVIEAELKAGETLLVLHPIAMRPTASAPSATTLACYVAVPTGVSPRQLASLVASAVEGSNV